MKNLYVKCIIREIICNGVVAMPIQTVYKICKNRLHKFTQEMANFICYFFYFYRVFQKVRHKKISSSAQFTQKLHCYKYVFIIRWNDRNIDQNLSQISFYIEIYAFKGVLRPSIFTPKP